MVAMLEFCTPHEQCIQISRHRYMNSFSLLFMIAFLAMVLSSCGIGPKGLSKLQSESWVAEYSPEFTTVENIPIRYVKAGQGPPLLLIHTIRTSIEYYKYILPELSRHYTVYALDLPGHGYSGLPKTEYSHSFFHNIVKQFILQQKLNDLTLVAESAGATVALTLGADEALAINSIYAFNPYDYKEKKGAGAKRANGFAKLVFKMMQPKALGPLVIRMELKFVLKKILSGGFVDRKAMPKDVLKSVYKVSKRKGFKQAELSYFMAWQSFVDARGTYSSIKAPVTLVYSESDWSLPSERTANAELIPHATLKEIEGASHFSCLEKPKEALKIILQQ